MKSITDYFKNTGDKFFLTIMIAALIGITGCGDDDNGNGPDPDPEPEITDVNPQSGPIGTAVTISGSNFSSTASENQVTFDGTEAEVDEATESEINTTVPEGAESGEVQVTVDGNTASGPSFDVTEEGSLTIESVEPDSGAVGDTVTINGLNFSATASDNSVTFNGSGSPATVNSATDTTIVTEVPEDATDGPIEVAVNGETASSSDFNVLEGDDGDNGDDGDGDDNGNGGNEGNTIPQAIADDDELSELSSLLEGTDLEGTLEGDGPYTILAPTNGALGNLSGDLSDDAIEEILSYHVINDDLASTDFNAGATIETLEGSSIYVAGNGNINNINNLISTGDNDADNGTIHTVNDILYPDAYSNVFAITYKRPSTNKFACTCVSGRTGLQTVLEDESTDFTLFAPTDEAFNSREVPVDSLEDGELQDLMDYHIIEGQSLTSEDLEDGQTLTTRTGEDITVSVDGDGNITLDDGTASVETVDLEGTNGVVHIIDTVMEPPADE